ncbi:carbonic anhydrase [bacterium]|nr:carbonic anhydrase [bacterium]
MSDSYERLLEGNRIFVARKNHEDPTFFQRLSVGQQPKYLWIGCSDSRVPNDQITSTNPGEIFTTRNIANLVDHTDMSMLSVLDYAVNHLKVDHIIVCGHYSCGGVRAAMSNQHHGLLDNWLRNIKDVYRLHHEELDAITDVDERERKLVEFNVTEQVFNVCKTSIVQQAWVDNKSHLPRVHGWVYDVANGEIKRLHVDYQTDAEFHDIFRFSDK